MASVTTPAGASNKRRQLERGTPLYALLHPTGKSILNGDWRHTFFLREADLSQSWEDLVAVQCRQRGIELTDDFDIYLLDMKLYVHNNPTYERLQREHHPKDGHQFPYISEDKEQRRFVDFTNLSSSVCRHLVSKWRSITYTLKYYEDLRTARYRYLLLVHSTVHLYEREAQPVAPPPDPNQYLRISDDQLQNIFISPLLKRQMKQIGKLFSGKVDLCLSNHADVAAYKSLCQQLVNDPAMTLRDTHGRATTPNQWLISYEEFQRQHAEEVNMQRHQTTSLLEKLLNRQKAVCTLRKADTCAIIATAFMISPFHLMTCFHCLYNVSNDVMQAKGDFQPASTSFIADFNDVADEKITEIDNTFLFDCSNIVFPENHASRKDIGFDVAILDVRSCFKESNKSLVKSITEHYIPLFTQECFQPRFVQSSKMSWSLKQHLHLIQYSNGHRNVGGVYDHFNGFIEWESVYKATTDVKTSGAPCLLPTVHLVAIHRRCSEKIRTEDGLEAVFAAGIRIDMFLRDIFDFQRFPAKTVSERPKDNPSKAVKDMCLELCALYHVDYQTLFKAERKSSTVSRVASKLRYRAPPVLSSPR